MITDKHGRLYLVLGLLCFGSKGTVASESIGHNMRLMNQCLRMMSAVLCYAGVYLKFWVALLLSWAGVTLTLRSITVVWVWALAAALVSAQITFSRDWTGGKRAAPHLALDCTQFTRLCRHFVHELKQAMTPEADSKRQRDELDKPPLYDDE